MLILENSSGGRNLKIQITGISLREYHALAQKIQPDRTIRVPNSEIFAEPKPIRIKKRHYVRHK